METNAGRQIGNRQDVTPFPDGGPEAAAWFERRVAEAVGASRAVVFTDVAEALEGVLRALVVGEGDQVLLSALAGHDLAEAVRRTGATPVALDIDPATFQVCPRSAEEAARRAAEAGKRPPVLVASHRFGIPCDMKQLVAVAERYGMPLVEDASEAFGAWMEEFRPAGWARTAIYRFGGEIHGMPAFAVLATGDPVLAGWILALQGGRRDLPEGLRDSGGTRELRFMLAREEQAMPMRRIAAAFYAEHLAELAEVQSPACDQETVPAWNRYVVRVEDRDELVRAVAEQAGIEPMVLPELWADSIVPCRPGGAEAYAARVVREAVALPTDPGLREEDLLRICLAVHAHYAGFRVAAYRAAAGDSGLASGGGGGGRRAGGSLRTGGGGSFRVRARLHVGRGPGRT